ncbi:MAG: DNA-binding domain-containing protein [Bryobacter sp.]|nr:DNA-binding domain-containing protein [Bryobacter sp.]
MQLRELQGWTQAAIQTPDALTQTQCQEARKLVRPSATLSPEARVEIYRGMYLARLRGALRVDYPLLFQLLGEERFEELTALYAEQHPSRSYTLNRFGDALPAFVRQVENLPYPSFVEDLVLFENLETQVFDAAEGKRQPLPDLSQIPAEQLENLLFEPIQALRLAEFRYPVHRYAAAYRNQQALRRPRPKATWLAIYRRDYQLQHLELDPQAYPILAGLASGLPLGQALAAGRHLHPRSLFRCFESWFSVGIFASVS